MSIISFPYLPAPQTLIYPSSLYHARPFEGYSTTVLGAINPLLEPFCGHSSQTFDKTFKSDFLLRLERPCVPSLHLGYVSLRGLSEYCWWIRRTRESARLCPRALNPEPAQLPVLGCTLLRFVTSIDGILFINGVCFVDSQDQGVGEIVVWDSGGGSFQV